MVSRFERISMSGMGLSLTGRLFLVSVLIGQMVLWPLVGVAQGTVIKSARKAKALTEEQFVVHLLDRTTFGPRPGDIDRVLRLGWKKYLNEQLNPEGIDDKVAVEKLRGIESIHLSGRELAKYSPPPQVLLQISKDLGIELPVGQEAPQVMPGGETQPVGEKAPARQQMGEQIRRARQFRQALAEKGYKPRQQAATELQQAKILRAVYSERQLQEVMTDFWFNHFNVFIQKGADRVLTTVYERDVIRPRVFGKFEDLLRATAQSPAMLFYLDNWMSVAEAADRGGRRTEMARQMAPQRRARGLNENYAREIMELHTLGVDGGYTQKDVREVARCFTGWTIRNLQSDPEFAFVPRMHDDGEKVVLGTKIPAGGGRRDAETVIHLLATHPSTAKFISTKLARRFVTDDPPATLTEAMARTFQRTGGDLREVLLTLFDSKEFRDPSVFRAKIKTPFEMTVSAVRAIGAETNGGPAFHRWIAEMGEGLYLAQPPTGHPDRADHWVNSGALLARMNFAVALTANKIPGTRVDPARLNPVGNGRPEAPEAVVDRYVTQILRGTLSDQSRKTIDRAIADQGGTAEVTPARVASLILGSPEFQRQ